MSLREAYEADLKREKESQAREKEAAGYFSDPIRIGNLVTQLPDENMAFDLRTWGGGRDAKSFSAEVRQLFQEAVALVKPDRWQAVEMAFDEKKVVPEKEYEYPTRFDRKEFTYFGYYKNVYEKEQFSGKYRQITEYVQLVCPDGSVKMYPIDKIRSDRYHSFLSKSSAKKQLRGRVDSYFSTIGKIMAKSQRYVLLKYITPSGDGSIGGLILFDDGNVYKDYLMPHALPHEFFKDPQTVIVKMIRMLNQ